MSYVYLNSEAIQKSKTDETGENISLVFDVIIPCLQSRETVLSQPLNENEWIVIWI